MALEQFPSWRVKCDGRIPASDPERAKANGFPDGTYPCTEEMDWSYWTKAEARDQAREQGWKVKASGVLCPSCAERGE